MATFNTTGRFVVMDITITYEQPSMKNRFEIRYFDKHDPGKKYGVVVVEGSSYGSGSMLDILQVVAEKAAQMVGSMDFYEAMREYVMQNLPYDYENVNPFGKHSILAKKKKHSDHNHHTHFAVDFNSDPNAEPWDIDEYGNPALAIKTPPKYKQGAKTKQHDPGPDMNEINALPGIYETAKHPISGSELPIRDIIINLNDQHMWTREAVADWLETLDVDLRFKTEDDRLREQREKKLQEVSLAIAKCKHEIEKLATNMALLKADLAKFELQYQTLLEEENEQG